MRSKEPRATTRTFVVVTKSASELQTYLVLYFCSEIILTVIIVIFATLKYEIQPRALLTRVSGSGSRIIVHCIIHSCRDHKHENKTLRTIHESSFIAFYERLFSVENKGFLFVNILQYTFLPTEAKIQCAFIIQTVSIITVMFGPAIVWTLLRCSHEIFSIKTLFLNRIIAVENNTNRGIVKNATIGMEEWRLNVVAWYCDFDYSIDRHHKKSSRSLEK